MDVTYNFTAGTRAVAGQVNTNFADVKSAVDPLETSVANIETQLTSGIILPDGSVDFTRLQSYATYVVSNATNATPIVITAVAHPFLTGDKVQISGVGGNTAANGTFTITKTGADTFSLDDSVGNGTFDTNGTAIIVPVSAGNLINKAYLDANAGALKIDELGTISTNTTLDANKVSTANITGSVAISLPTNIVAGNENVVVFDFTTGSTSQPTITSSRNLTGTCAVTNGDATVTGTSTLFLTELEVGSKITIATVDYQVLSIASNTSLELTANYAGTNASGLTVGHKFVRWSDKNGGKAPSVYSVVSGVRNILVFKTHDGGITWEAEYSTYGAVETEFTFPTLTANGTLGSASAAVSGSSVYSGQDYYYAVDSNITTTTCGLSSVTSSYTWYNPTPFKVSQYNYRNRPIDNGSTYTPTAGTFYYSDDGVNWVLEQSFTNSVTTENTSWNVPISELNQGYHKYRKAIYTATSGAYGGIYYSIPESRPVGYIITT